ncbi:hypothetical protein B566_EDAN016684 [Ephemera danica]|nr:hypothetical protein B566_EDAN016684 [Ephemera danica]
MQEGACSHICRDKEFRMFLIRRPVPMIIRDDSPMQPAHHYYWEIKVSHVKYRYASDGWFGVGTDDVTQVDATNLMNSSTSRDNFWGYGSNGTISHNKEVKQYGPHFHEGDTLGAHLDLYHGTLEFHRNKKPLGIAFTGLPNNVTMYPILIGATAIPTPGEMIGPLKFLPSLQLNCYQHIARTMSKEDVLRVVPPGLVHLVNALEFLHCCTGEPANPGLYMTNFEMVIVSDSEEENRVTRPVRRKRRKNVSTPRAPAAAWSDSDEAENWTAGNRRRLASTQEPSCSSWDTGRTRSRTHALASTSQQSKAAPQCKSRPKAKPPKKREPLKVTESLPARTTRSRSAAPVPRKSQRIMKKAAAGC